MQGDFYYFLGPAGDSRDFRIRESLNVAKLHHGALLFGQGIDYLPHARQLFAVLQFFLRRATGIGAVESIFVEREVLMLLFCNGVEGEVACRREAISFERIDLREFAALFPRPYQRFLRDVLGLIGSERYAEGKAKDFIFQG